MAKKRKTRSKIDWSRVGVILAIISLIWQISQETPDTKLTIHTITCIQDLNKLKETINDFQHTRNIDIQEFSRNFNRIKSEMDKLGKNCPELSNELETLWVVVEQYYSFNLWLML